jgi:hypothetical protein
LRLSRPLSCGAGVVRFGLRRWVCWCAGWSRPAGPAIGCIVKRSIRWLGWLGVVSRCGCGWS